MKGQTLSNLTKATREKGERRGRIHTRVHFEGSHTPKSIFPTYRHWECVSNDTF